MYSLACFPIRPCWWRWEVIFHMHIQVNTDSQTLGGLLNVNKGFSLTKGRKEKRKGEKKEKRWEKPTFLKEWSRSKAFYSQRRLSRGVTTVSPPESWKVSPTSQQWLPLQEGERQWGLQKWTLGWSAKMEIGPRNRRTALCRPGRPPGPQSRPKHVFHSEKVCIHKSWGTNYSTTTWHN